MPGSSARLAGQRSRLAPWLIILIAILAIVAGYTRYRSGTRLSIAADKVPDLIRSAVAISPGIYLLGGLSPSAAYVLESSEGFVLIDSGLDRDAGRLKSQMVALGLDWKRVRAILLTHAHGDHVGGAEALRRETRAKVYAGEGDAAVLRAGQPREAFFSTFYMPDHSPHPTEVDVALKGNENLVFGDLSILALSTPGHTPGSTCYLSERNNVRALFAGDVIMMLRGDEVPRSELGKPLGTYSVHLSPRYRGNAQDYLASLHRLRALTVPDLVLPGHPGADVTPQNPHLSQERWESLLDQGIHELETLVRRYETDGAPFLDGTPKQILPDLYYLGDSRGLAVYGFFASSRFFVVDPPGEPGVAEFVGNRIRQLGREPTNPTTALLTSWDPAESAGLLELIEKYHIEVVAAPAALESLRKSCPSGTRLLSAADAIAQDWFSASLIPLPGQGSAPIAYRFGWNGKTVLCSGRIPRKINEESAEHLIRDLTHSKVDIRDYFASLTLLHSVNPDVWLPAMPVDGQNANLYDSEWERVIEDNLLVVKGMLGREAN